MKTEAIENNINNITVHIFIYNIYDRAMIKFLKKVLKNIFNTHLHFTLNYLGDRKII